MTRRHDALFCALFCDLTRALETLELLGTSGRHDFLVMAALETHGYFKLPELVPERARNWDSQMVEIKAHNIFAEGADVSEAIRNWMLVARRQARITDQLARAEHLLRAPDTDPRTLRRACRTILSEGRSASIQNAARATLAGLDDPAMQPL